MCADLKNKGLTLIYSWAVGQSYADHPQYQSWSVRRSLAKSSLLMWHRYFDPSQPAGSRWAKAATSTIPRMYHSSASLLPDGSVIISGSNPNADC